MLIHGVNWNWKAARKVHGHHVFVFKSTYSIRNRYQFSFFARIVLCDTLTILKYMVCATAMYFSLFSVS